jgi:peptidoglycan/LPS O-acetylase OafA/YrhL
MIPDWLVVLLIFVAFAAGWVSHQCFDAEVRKDERIVDDALSRAWRAGWRSARDE